VLDDSSISAAAGYGIAVQVCFAAAVHMHKDAELCAQLLSIHMLTAETQTYQQMRCSLNCVCMSQQMPVLTAADQGCTANNRGLVHVAV
jgi:hypothetical protein